MCNRVLFFVIWSLFSQFLYSSHSNEGNQSADQNSLDSFFDESLMKYYLNENDLSKSQVEAQYGKHHFAHVLLGVVVNNVNNPSSQILLSHKNVPIRFFSEDDLLLAKDDDYLTKFLDKFVISDIKTFGYYYQSLKNFDEKKMTYLRDCNNFVHKINHDTFPVQKYRYYLAHARIEYLDKLKLLGWQEYSAESYTSKHYDGVSHQNMLRSIHDSMQQLKNKGKNIFSGSGKVLHFSPDIPKELQKDKSKLDSFFKYRHDKKKRLLESEQLPGEEAIVNDRKINLKKCKK